MARELTPAERAQRQKAAVRHGGYVRSPAARKLVRMRAWRKARKLRAALPDLPASAEPLLHRLAHVQIVLEGVYAELALNGVATANGEDRRLLGEARRWTREERELLREIRTLSVSNGPESSALAELLAQSRNGDAE